MNPASIIIADRNHFLEACPVHAVKVVEEQGNVVKEDVEFQPVLCIGVVPKYQVINKLLASLLFTVDLLKNFFLKIISKIIIAAGLNGFCRWIIVHCEGYPARIFKTYDYNLFRVGTIKFF